MFDVFLDNKGFLIPKDFIELFSNNIKIPEIIYTGNLNWNFTNSIRINNYTLPNCLYPTVKEGVVCKNNYDMTKVKTDWWINKLKNTHPDKFDELC